jgi:hypothetical protein
VRPAYPGRRPASNGLAAHHAAEVEALASERFVAVGQTLLSALADSGLSARRAANVLSWFVVAQLALGPWRSRGEVRPAALAESMGVSRWTEWRARRDAVRAGVVRDWSLPDPEARGYGRGAVRVVELAFVRTRAVTQKVTAIKEERATRAERRREARARSKDATRVVAPAAAAEPPPLPTAPVTRQELTSAISGRLWEMVQRLQLPEAPAEPAPAGPRPPPG